MASIRAASTWTRGGFDAAEAQAVIAQTNFHRVAERGEADDLDFLAFQQAHFHQALDKAVLAVDGRDAAAAAGSSTGRG